LEDAFVPSPPPPALSRVPPRRFGGKRAGLLLEVRNESMHQFCSIPDQPQTFAFFPANVRWQPFSPLRQLCAMPKRCLKATKWLGRIPIIGICTSAKRNIQRNRRKDCECGYQTLKEIRQPDSDRSSELFQVAS